MTVAIFCGSRDWTDAARVAAGVAWARLQGITEIAHGGCRGADRMAAGCASAAGLDVHAFPADWSRGRRARAAGVRTIVVEGGR